MRTAQHKGINPRCHQLLQIPLRRLSGNLVVRPALLRKRHKQGTRLREHLHFAVLFADHPLIRAGAHRPRCPDYADFLILRGAQCLLHARHNHAEDGHIKRLAQRIQTVGACRIAGNNNRLHFLAQQKPYILLGIFRYGLLGFRPVGHARRIPEIYNIFMGHHLHNLLYHSQTANPRIKYTDWSCIHFFLLLIL